MRELKKHSFSKVFDLQNSSRTNFYKNILFPKAKKETWSSSITTLPEVIDKKEFDKHSVLDRFNHQLQTSGLKTSHTLNPNFSWAGSEISKIKDHFKLNKFILLFPFCSPHLHIKKWPYYNDLIKLILDKFGNEYKIVLAPGPSEINDAKEINSKLWVIEDDKRQCEKDKDFGEKFIKLSRDVHFLNDDRAKIKLEINNHTSSVIKEIKEYTSY